MVWWRERLFQNAYNRRIMWMVVLASCGIFLSRLLMMQLDVPLAHALVADLVLLAGISGAAVLTIQGWTFWLSGLCACAAVAAAMFPSWIPLIVGGTALAASVIALVFVRLQSHSP